MAVANDATAANNSTSFQATPFTGTFTCTGANRFLLGWVTHNNSSNDATGLSYNSVAMTKVNDYSNTSAWAQLWRLTGPASGSNSFSLAYSGSATHRITWVSLTGVDPVTPIGTIIVDNTSNGSATALGATTSAAGGMVISFIALGNSGKSLTSTGTSQTTLGTPGADVDGNADSGAAWQPGAASVTSAWSCAGTQRIVAVSIPINAVAGGRVCIAGGDLSGLGGVGQMRFNPTL